MHSAHKQQYCGAQAPLTQTCVSRQETAPADSLRSSGKGRSPCLLAAHVLIKALTLLVFNPAALHFILLF